MFSIGLVMVLALSNCAYAQISSKDYLSSISDLASRQEFREQFVINPLRKLYYEHLLQTDSQWKALAFMFRLRAEAEYRDAWSLIDFVSNDFSDNFTWSFNETNKEPVLELAKNPANDPVIAEPAAVITRVPVSTIVNDRIAMKPVEKKATLATNKPLAEAGATTNEVTVSAPAPKTSLEMAKLESVRNSDYIEFGSIGFYRNAVVIHPSFEADMESLAKYMKENSNFALRIHGHCNGNEPRTIITPPDNSRFFAVASNNEEKTASAKELSELRADYAKRYLVSQGICPDRIQISGEGGTEMVYPETSVYAHYNERIELEIIRPTSATALAGFCNPSVSSAAH